MIESINIAYATGRDFQLTIVSLESLISHLKYNAHANIYILVDDSFTTKYKKKFISYIKLIKNIHIHFIRVDGYENAFQKMQRISNITYFRLSIPESICCDKIIYLDNDVIIRKDITELWEYNISGYYAAGVLAPWYVLEANHDEYGRLSGIQDMTGYVNAGVLLLNLRKIREDGLAPLLKNEAFQKYPSQDQDIINKFLGSKMLHLPYKFNLMTKYASWDEERLKTLFGEKEFLEARNSPVIIHYADSIKPWNSRNSPYASEWHREAKKNKKIYFQIMKRYWVHIMLKKLKNFVKEFVLPPAYWRLLRKFVLKENC